MNTEGWKQATDEDRYKSFEMQTERDGKRCEEQTGLERSLKFKGGGGVMRRK